MTKVVPHRRAIRTVRASLGSLTRTVALDRRVTRPTARALRLLALRRLLPSVLYSVYARLELTSPTTPRGRAALAMIRRRDATRSVPRLSDRVTARILATERRYGMSTGDLAACLEDMLSRSGRTSGLICQLLVELAADGDRLAADAAIGVAHHHLDRSDTIRCRRELAALWGDDDAAAALEDELSVEPSVTPQQLADLRVSRFVRFGHHHDLLEAWRCHGQIAGTAVPAAAVANSLLALGRASDPKLVELIRAPSTLGSDERSIVRLEHEILLGREAEALRIVRSLPVHAYRNTRLFRLVIDVRRHVAAESDDVISEWLDHAARSFGGRDLSARILAVAELGDADAVLGFVAEHPGSQHRLDAHATYAVAQAYYSMRRFDRALGLLAALRDGPRRWDAQKLVGRVLFERGEFAAALAQRERYGRPTRHIDEVSYHCLLHLGRYAEAFGMYCPVEDRGRLGRVFPSTATSVAMEGPGHQMIVAQAGPGDEIQLASLYRDVRARVNGMVSVTADPRLAPLIARSFPEFEVIPVPRRTRVAQWGWSAHGAPARSGDDLSDVLTMDAKRHALRADAVTLARDLPLLAATRERSSAAAPYLRVDPASAELQRRWLERRRPAVGLVWRSELRSVMRSIHYVTVAELEPLFRLPLDVICLQQDASDDERRFLAHRLGDRLRVPTTDLRNDLDGAASLVSVLDAVVGVGTTLVELAGAVGTKTVVIQPNHFGSWRAVESDERDFWHETVRVATTPDILDRSAHVRRAAEVLSSWLDLPVAAPE